MPQSALKRDSLSSATSSTSAHVEPNPSKYEMADWMTSAPDDVTKVLFGDNPTIWVFGYGSLLWKPDFQYKSKVIGYIAGYERRFNQGNETFRGVPGKPGRVANLEENKEGLTWGVAFEISGREEVAAVLKNLYHRETACGGYTTLITTFYPRQSSASHRDGHHHHHHHEKDHQNSPHIIPEWDSKITDEDVAKLFHNHSQNVDLRRSDSAMSMSSTDSSSDEEEQNTAIFTNSSIEMSSVESIPSVSQNEFQNISNVSTNAMGFHIEDNNDEIVFHSVDTSSVEKSHVNVNIVRSEPRVLHNENHLSPVQVLVYTANPDNSHYLGADDVTKMAKQIANCSGTAGTNVEYVTKIAEFVRKYIPEDNDQHLFLLEAKIIEEVHKLRRSKDGSFFSMSDFRPELEDLDHDAISTEPVVAS